MRTAEEEKTRIGLSDSLWIPKIPSESFEPKFRQVDEFNFDWSFVYSNNSAYQSLGQGRHPPAKSDHRPPNWVYGLFRRVNLVAPSRFFRRRLPPFRNQSQIGINSIKLPADIGDAGRRPRGLR
jgi:hypothetical protein